MMIPGHSLLFIEVFVHKRRVPPMRKNMQISVKIFYRLTFFLNRPKNLLIISQFDNLARSWINSNDRCVGFDGVDLQGFPTVVARNSSIALCNLCLLCVASMLIIHDNYSCF